MSDLKSFFDSLGYSFVMKLVVGAVLLPVWITWVVLKQLAKRDRPKGEAAASSHTEQQHER